MLIKNYSPQEHKTLCHTPLYPSGEFQGTYKWLKYFFDTNILSANSNTPTELKTLFNNQEKQLEEELKVLTNYKLLTKTAVNTIRQQYKDLYFYQWYTYLKSSLLEETTQLHRSTTTYIEPSPLETTQTTQQSDTTPPNNTTPQTTNSTEDILSSFIFNPNKNPLIKEVGISTQSIRNLTGYSYTTIPAWSPTQTPTTIHWQRQMLEDTSDILVIDGSRQMGKSYGIAELLIEESFVPGADILVAAFLQKTTNAILNYMKKFLTNFSEDDFSIFKKDGYILNNTTNVSIHFRTLSDWGENVRGLTTRLVVIDEAQKISSSIIDEVINPTLTTTGWRLVLIGTADEDINCYMYEVIIDIAKAQIYNNPEQLTARHIRVSADNNPLIHPTRKKYIYDNKSKPAIQREYFNRWGKSEDSRFNPTATSISDPNNPPPTPSPQGHIILAMDPARKKDRSAYCYLYASANQIIILKSWEVPPQFKDDWNLQAQYHLSQLAPFKEKYKTFSTVIDATGVGDGVVSIFQKAGLHINHTIRYTSGQSESEPIPDHFNVAKHILINNLLDLWENKHVTIIEETNQLLMEEFSYLNLKESRFWSLWFDSKFFDDCINATMIGLYMAKKARYMYRMINESWYSSKSQQQILKDEFSLYKNKNTHTPSKQHGHW